MLQNIESFAVFMKNISKNTIKTESSWKHIFSEHNKQDGNSKVGAIPKTQKRQIFKICLERFYEKLKKSFKTPKGCLWCSGNAPEVQI